MSARSFVWLSIGGGAWGLGFNWADMTDGTDPSAVAPGAQDSVTFAGPTGASVQTVTGPGQAAAALFTGNTLLSGSFSIAQLTLGQADAGGLLELASGTALQSGTASIVSGSLITGAGAGLSVSGTLALGGAGGTGAACNVTGGGTASVLSLFMASAGDSIYVDPASILEVGGTGQGRAGQLTIDAGGMLAGQGDANAYGAVTNNGTLAAQGGTLAVGALSGTGSLVVGGGATLRLDGACASGQSVSFAGANATLALQAEYDAPAGTLSGFAAGDAIDVCGSLISQASFQAAGTGGGTLTLFYGIQVAATLSLAGDYTGDVFLTTGDGAGGTLVTLAQAAGGGSGGASPGTSTPDQYSWIGGQSAAWSSAADWADTTRGQNPAAVAPGVNDLVTIAASQSAFSVIGGPANAASTAITGEVALTGAFGLGTLTLGSVSGPSYTAGALDLLAGTRVAAKYVTVSDGALSLAGSHSSLSVGGTLMLGGTPLGVGLPTASLSVTQGAVVQAGTLQMGGGSGDSIVTDPTGTLEVGTAGQAAAGAVTVDAGALLNGNGSINPYGLIVDNGTILASGGTLTLGSVSGTGSLAVAGGATLELRAATAAAITLRGSQATGYAGLAFAGALAAPTGVISGFTAGDVIEYEGSPLTSVQFVAGSNGGTLLLIYGTTVVTRLNLAGSFTNARFIETPDGSGGTVVSLTTATGGGGTAQGGTDPLAWTNPVSGAWGQPADWTDLTTGNAASAPPGPQTPVTIAGPGGAVFEDVTGQGTCASLTATGNTLLTGGFATGQLSAASGVLVIGGATTLAASQANVAGELLASTGGARLSVAGTLSLAGTVSLAAAQAHGQVQCGTLSLAGGQVTADATATFEVGTLGAPALGGVTIDAGAVASGFGSLNPFGPVIDNGTILAQSGTLSVGSVTGTGSLSVGTGATLALLSGDACPITLSGGGATLLVAGAALPTGTITGFAAGDAIVAGDTPIDSTRFQQGSGGLGTLTLDEAGQAVGQLLLAGNYAGQTFVVLPDGAGAAITLGMQPTGGPPAGTATPDHYVWLGGQGPLWSQAANWDDVTSGQSPAAVAPGLNDLVAVAGGTGSALVIDGPGNAAALSLTGTVSLAGTYSLGTLAVGMAGSAGLLALGAGGGVTAGSARVTGGVALDGGALSVEGTLALGAAGQPGGILDVSAGLAQAEGAVLAGTASALVVGTGGAAEIGGTLGAAAGTLQIDPGGVLAGAGLLSAAGGILDRGTITASGGTLSLGAVSGTGLLVVGVGAGLALSGTAAGGLTVDFAGGGTLSLGQAARTGGPAIADFGGGDAILLAAGGATAALYTQTAPGSGVLTIEAGTQTLAELTLLGEQSGLAFSVAGSAGGGTILTAQPDNTSGTGGTFMTNPTSSGGSQVTPSALEASLGSAIPYAIGDLTGLLGTTTAYAWFSADGLAPGAADTQDINVDVVGPLPQGSGSGDGPGFQMALQAGYQAVVLEGQENVQLTDGALGDALLVGNYGTDELAALGDNDTLVGATGANTTFYASLHAGAHGSPTGHDVVIRGGGNDTIATNNDAAAITTSGGHSEVFLGSPQNYGATNNVRLDGSDTVICGGTGQTEDYVTVGAAAGLAGNLAFGPALGTLNFVGGATASTVVGTGGQVLEQGGAANGNILWAGRSAVSYEGGAGSASIVGGSSETYVHGGSGPVTVFGGTGQGIFSGAAGSAFVVGDGASTVQAAAGVGVYITGGANVSVAGSAGADVYGGTSTGDNIFQAGAGSETLWGGLGSDTFLAGAGSHALLISGGGDDVFSFLYGANNGASDTIVGFVPGQSTIDLSGYGSTAPTITYGYGDSILNLADGSQIVVYDVSNLTAASLTLR